ncbi:hypothetical protein B0T10DRAFT_461751 [Thelonectria olida]|uniref:Aspartate/glutamate racemase family protein n=1 Tax=Thelonectria olida TaxID=1576542 RepID=A0A9P9ANC1_9HYPO|nr:hypothetical protein B0T10DRAFT_461751 [Thelonectria olida]
MAGEPTERPPLGFLAVEVDIFRPPGDPFNETTWEFPLIREKVTGTGESQIVTDSAYDDAFIDRFVAAGLKLAQRGAVGIITSCGFLAMAQKRLASRLPIPVATSALVQVPSLRALLPADKAVGVFTYDSRRLGDAHLMELGINPDGVRIWGLPDDSHLRGICARGEPYDAKRLERELVDEAKAFVEKHPEVAVVVLECTNMPPYGDAIQNAINLPVYDVYTMGNWFYSGLLRTNPRSWRN